MIEIQLDALAEHVRDLIWDQLQSELELKTCQQGCPEQLRTPDDLADALNAVLLDPPKWAGGAPDQDLPAMEGTVTLHLSFLRRITVGEEHPRTTVQQLQKIAALFSAPGFRLTGWDDSAGLEVEKIWPADVAHEHDLTYEDSTVRVSLGYVSLQAKVVAYDPAG